MVNNTIPFVRDEFANMSKDEVLARLFERVGNLQNFVTTFISTSKNTRGLPVFDEELTPDERFTMEMKLLLEETERLYSKFDRTHHKLTGR